MASTHYSLLLLRLPGNVEREVYRIKNTLFSASGAVSSQTPPVLPLTAIQPETDESIVDSLRQTEISPLCLGPISEECGCIVISTQLVDAWGRMIEAASTVSASSHVLPTGLPGFLLASSSDVEAREWQQLSVAALPKHLSVVMVENWSLEVRGYPWWSDYSWKVAWSHRVKLRG